MSPTLRVLLPTATAFVLTIASAVSFVRGAEIRAGDLAIVSAWARATPPGASVGAAYVTVDNRGAQSDRLLSAETPAASSIMVHRTVSKDGVATMRGMENPDLPPGGRLAMRPGETHLMLMGLKTGLKAGESIALTLHFEKAGAVVLSLPVAPLGASEPPTHDHKM